MRRREGGTLRGGEAGRQETGRRFNKDEVGKVRRWDVLSLES